MALVLTDGWLLPMTGDFDPVPADIRIVDGSIADIGAHGSLGLPGDEIVDCSGALLFPGLINTHTHAATVIYRGRVEDVPAASWGNYQNIPGQNKLDAQDYADAAKLACAEFLLNGVTCIADRLDGMIAIAPAIEAAGMRAVVGQTLTDRQIARQWRDMDELYERYGANPASRISIGVAPHALDSCSDDLLRRCGERADAIDARVFVHVAQCRAEIEALGLRGHAGALQCLRQTGLANSRTVAAHCIHLTADEREALPETGIGIAHCPASNIKVEGLTLPIAGLIGQVPIGLGTDWSVSNNTLDLLAEARLACLVGKLNAADPEACRYPDMLRMLTIDGAALLGIDKVVGSLDIGKQADIVVFDIGQLAAAPHANIAANLLHSMSVRAVRDVFVAGRQLVRRGRLVEMDELELGRLSVALGSKMGQA